MWRQAGLHQWQTHRQPANRRAPHQENEERRLHIKILTNEYGRFRIGPGGREDYSSPATEYVAVETIDRLELQQCDFIIDVQGFEKQVLQGMEDTLTRFHPVVVIENDKLTEDLQMHLNLFGYSCYWHFHYLFNPENFHKVKENYFNVQGELHYKDFHPSDTSYYGAVSLNMLCTHPQSALAIAANKEIDRMGLKLAQKGTLKAYAMTLLKQRDEMLALLANPLGRFK